MKSIQSLIQFIHHYLIGFVIFSYLLAAIMPHFGLWIRQSELKIVNQAVPLPLLMLAILLFNAGLGIQKSELKQLLKKPVILLSGIIGNWLIPFCFILILSFVMRLWHNSEEAQQILVGLALVIAMPIAGASTAWSQNANGNLTLSLGLVLFTTLLSPLFTPLIFYATGLLTVGDYSQQLYQLASQGVVQFLGVWVVFPAILGVSTHYLITENTLAKLKPFLKLTNYLVLILLNYANASLTLPEVIANPDFDFLIVMFFIVSLLCIITFYSGYVLAHYFKANQSNTISLMFGLGMNNNGTALVLASISLSSYPEIMLPIIFYNLIQHLMASLVDRELFFYRIS